jgi:hypothetical protein
VIEKYWELRGQRLLVPGSQGQKVVYFKKSNAIVTEKRVCLNGNRKNEGN